ncbi:MAG: hypothetical protein ABR507_12330 [Actinomycetota bacterium]|nr:hypothetical protein [Actinomycetota bacterium]
MDDETGIGIATVLDFDVAVMRTRLCLRSNGFRILSEMPAPASIGEGGRQHLFLCVWEQVIHTENLGGQGLDVGDHLACNIVVYEQDGSTLIAGLDPTEGLDGWALDNAMAAKGAIWKAISMVGTETV